MHLTQPINKNPSAFPEKLTTETPKLKQKREPQEAVQPPTFFFLWRHREKRLVCGLAHTTVNFSSEALRMLSPDQHQSQGVRVQLKFDCQEQI